MATTRPTSTIREEKAVIEKAKRLLDESYQLIEETENRLAANNTCMARPSKSSCPTRRLVHDQHHAAPAGWVTGWR
jgi:hypothetical protein